MKNLKTFEQFISTKIQEGALKAGEESDLYIDDVQLDSGKAIKSAEILGSILAKSTEKEFKQYFYDEYGEGAFAEGEIDQLVKMYNDYKTEEAEKEKEEEGEEEEDDPLAGI